MVLGIVVWLHGAFAIDPGSERVLVNDTPTVLRWRTVEWQPGRSGLSAPHNKYFAMTSQSDSGQPVEIDQQLFELSYSDHFGNQTFEILVKIWALSSPGETSFNLFPIVDGGGNTDGAFNVAFDYDDSARILQMNFTQWIHSKRVAKQATLFFEYDGNRFRTVTAPNHRSG